MIDTDGQYILIGPRENIGNRAFYHNNSRKADRAFKTFRSLKSALTFAKNKGDLFINLVVRDYGSSQVYFVNYSRRVSV